MPANTSHELVIDSFYGALIKILEKKPLEKTNVSEICKVAGVSRVSFYRNYNSIPDILKKHLYTVFDEWWVEFSKKNDEEFHRAFWVELLSLYKENSKLIYLIYSNNLGYIIKDHIFASCGPKDGMSNRQAYTCAMVAGMIYGLVDEWIRKGMKDIPNGFSVSEAIRLFNR